MAYKTIQNKKAFYEMKGYNYAIEEEGYTLLSLVVLEDTPRNEQKQYIEQFQNANICVRMVTGDIRSTSIAVAQSLGFKLNSNPADNCISGMVRLLFRSLGKS